MNSVACFILLHLLVSISTESTEGPKYGCKICKYEAAIAITKLTSIERQDILNFLLQDEIPAVATTDDVTSTCDFCLHWVPGFASVLITGTSLPEFLQELEAFCDKTGRVKIQCKKIVDEEYRGLFDYLDNRLNATKICAEVKACTGGF